MADPAYIVDGVLTDGEAWVGLNTTTLGSDTATVTFTSTDDGQVGDFSQYMDLVLITYARSARTGDESPIDMRFNNDTASNYVTQMLKGINTSASAVALTATYAQIAELPATSQPANYRATSITTLFDINSGKYKSGTIQWSRDSSGGDGSISRGALTWKSQAPIAEIDLYDLFGGDFLTGSSFSLFGVLPRMVA